MVKLFVAMVNCRGEERQRRQEEEQLVTLDAEHFLPHREKDGRH